MRSTWKVIGTVTIAGAMLTGCLTPGDHVVTSTLQNNSATPGLWHTFGGDSCYWERLRGFSGETSDIIANDISDGGPRYVEIKAGDAGFNSSNCVPWVQADGPFDRTLGATAAGQFGQGDYRVGHDVPAGTYQATDPTDCYWERVTSFGGETSDIIANGIGGGIVTIAPSDVGFRTSNCGTWTKIG